MTTNEELRTIYDQHYAAGDQWHTPVDTWEESLLIHRLGGDWRGKSVVELGCGTGKLACFIAENGARKVLALDYSEEAIKIARQTYQRNNLEFWGMFDPYFPHDVLVMQGVLEHQDNWRQFLQERVNYLAPGGHIITSSPAFINPRGYIWQTLRLLLNVPMSKTDLHAINPWDVQAWCVDNKMNLTYQSCHHDWGAGELMLIDYEHRLPKALSDAGLPTDGVPKLLEWLKIAGSYDTKAVWSGATIVYKIGPKP